MSGTDAPLLQPWEADHDLSLAEVEAIAGGTVSVLGEGFDYRAFRSGDEVLRFPKRADVAAGTPREVVLLQAIAPRLPIAVPLLEWRAGGPYGHTRHPFLAGRSLRDGDVSRTQARWISARLGDVFSILHATPAEIIAQAGVPDAGWDDPVAHHRKAVARLRALTSRMPRDVVQRVERALDDPPRAGAGDRPLIHSDAWPEHLLVDEVSMELTGIIDWADAERGDPARDAAPAWLLGGDEALTTYLDHYEQPWDDAFAARARFFAIHHAIGEAWYALERGRDPDLAIALKQLTSAG